MKKKAKILGGSIIILTTLFINLIFPTDSDISEIVFDNVEALAQKESGDFTPTCIYVGVLCIGVNEGGITGRHYGLSAVKP